MYYTTLVAAMILIIACGCNGHIASERDVGSSATDAGTSDLADIRVLPDTCRSMNDCPRGEQCLSIDGSCYFSTGCGAVWNEFAASQTGCWYGHGEDLLYRWGNYGFIECRSHDDCEANWWGPYCIHQMCHPDPPCENDGDCPGDWQCFAQVICADPSRLDGV